MGVRIEARRLFQRSVGHRRRGLGGYGGDRHFESRSGQSLYRRANACPEACKRTERDRAYDNIEAEIIDEFKAFNSWICGVSQSHSEIVPFIGADAAVLPGDDGGAYVRDMVGNHGARGVKLHGPAQGVSMSDERLWPIYAAAEAHGFAVGVHAGTAYRFAPWTNGWPSYHIEDQVAQSVGVQTQLLSLITEGVFE